MYPSFPKSLGSPSAERFVSPPSRWTATTQNGSGVAVLLLSLILCGCQSTRPSPPATDDSAPSSRPAASTTSNQPWLVKEFIYESAPFPSAHASTLADTPHGLVAAWFGGSDEGNKDVGIWVSRHQDGRWTDPVLVAEGIAPDDPNRHPCWNPVLFQMPLGPLVLFYKVGPTPRSWWGMRLESTNYGRSWSQPERLPEDILGPVRNKPALLPQIGLLCGSSTEDQGWRIHLERSPDAGRHWSRTPPLNDPSESGLIQPTLLAWPNGRVQLLCRSRQGSVYQSWMGDDWAVWSRPVPTALPNPNSGIDGLVLKDGRALLVYNHTRQGRSPLNVALSPDGRTWNPSVVLEDEPGEYSYPAVIQSADGRVHITYTWKRQRIRHVVLDPASL